MGTLFVDKLDPQSGTSLELGSSGDTVSVPSGATLDVPSGATLDVTGATVSGLSTEVNTPYFQMQRTGSNQTTSDGTYTKIQFNSSILDSDSGVDASTDYDYTIPSGKGGKYLITTSAFVSKGTGNNAIYYYGLDIRKNNQRVAEAFLDMRNPSNSISDISQQLSQTCTAVLNLAAGDVITSGAEVFTNGNSNILIKYGAHLLTYMQGFRITAS
jgi:hypothetical protein